MAAAESGPRAGYWACVIGIGGLYAVGALAILLLPVSWGGVVLAVGDALRGALGWTGFGYGWIEFVANILLFAPLGLLVALVLPRWWWGVAVAVVISAAVELGQIFIPGRLPSVRDVVANVLGAAIGALAGLALRRVLRPRGRGRRPSGIRTPDAP